MTKLTGEPARFDHHGDVAFHDSAGTTRPVHAGRGVGQPPDPGLKRYPLWFLVVC